MVSCNLKIIYILCWGDEGHPKSLSDRTECLGSILNEYYSKHFLGGEFSLCIHYNEFHAESRYLHLWHLWCIALCSYHWPCKTVWLSTVNSPSEHGDSFLWFAGKKTQVTEQLLIVTENYQMGGTPKNRGVSPQIIHLFIGFSIEINHPFWGGNKSPYIWRATPKSTPGFFWKTPPHFFDPTLNPNLVNENVTSNN